MYMHSLIICDGVRALIARNAYRVSASFYHNSDKWLLLIAGMPHISSTASAGFIMYYFACAPSVCTHHLHESTHTLC